MNTTGEQSLTTAQITETLSQTLGRALQSGASYSYSVQQAPQQTTHSQAGNMWLTHQLFESLRTQLNLQGTSNEIGDGSQTQITGSGNLIYQKKLPRNSDLQIQVGDSYQWNDQQMANSVVTQLNESIKITDITLSYPLANHNVTAISQVFNSTETIKYQDPADYGTFVIGNITYITINPTGLIHTGDVLLVTYQYMVDTDLTFTANTVSASASVTLFSNLLSVFGQFSDTQQHLISGNDTFAKLGNYKTASLGAQANVTNNTFGAKYIYTYNPGITEDSFNGYWWYSAVFGKNQLRLSLTDTYNSWTDNVTQAKNHNNALNAYVTANRQFTRSAQGSLAAGYIRTNGSTSENSAYFKAVLTYVLGKFQFWVNAQSLLNNYTNQSQTLNNTVSLQVRRNF